VRGFKYDEVNAVVNELRLTSVQDIEARLIALAEVRPTEHFEPVAASAKRIRKILEQANHRRSAEINPSLLQAGPESELYEALLEVEEQADVSRTKDYRASLLAIASLRPKVDMFFDKVMVNVDDERVRTNRLDLLSQLLGKFSTIADFSEIVTAGEK
jgi:glycyl-tRNA synthetase beta chain